MAFRVSHKLPGSMLSTAKVVVSDPASCGTAGQDIKIKKPAGSVVDAVFVYASKEIVLDTTTDLKFKLGTAADDDYHVESFILLDGSDGTNAKKLAKGALYKMTIANSDYSPGTDTSDEAVVSDDAGDVIANLSTAHTTGTESAGEIEIHVQFRHV